MMLSNFSTILLYLPAMREVSAANVPRAEQALAVGLVFVITALPIVAPLVVRVVAPGPSAQWFESLHRVVVRHQTQLSVVIEVVFGVYLLVKAIRG
jgi:threonine/homoserine/homoserine lactone efflux protein